MIFLAASGRIGGHDETKGEGMVGVFLSGFALGAFALAVAFLFAVNLNQSKGDGA